MPEGSPKDSVREKLHLLQSRGVTVWHTPLTGKHFDLHTLWQHCLHTTSSFHGLTSVLVEGGARTWDYVASVGVVDEWVTLVGDRQVY